MPGTCPIAPSSSEAILTLNMKYYMNLKPKVVVVGINVKRLFAFLINIYLDVIKINSKNYTIKNDGMA